MIMLKDVWIVFKGGFSCWFGWDSMGTILVIFGYVCLDGCTVVVTMGWSDVVFLVWFIIWERSVCGIHGGSIIVVSDGLYT